MHDEFGRVDPAKAAEPSKPRGSAGSKRPSRPSDEHRGPIKRPKLETEGEDAHMADHELVEHASIDTIDAMIDPALLAYSTDVYEQRSSMALNGHLEPLITENGVCTPGQAENPHARSPQLLSDSRQVAFVPTDQSPVVGLVMNFRDIAPSAPVVSVKAEPLQPGFDAEEDSQPTGESADGIVVHELPASAAQEVDESVATIEERAGADDASTKQPTTPLRHSSRRAKQVERYVPDDRRPSPMQPAKAVQHDHRASSSESSALTSIASLKSRRSSSNTSGTTHRVANNGRNKRTTSRELSGRPVSRGSVSASADGEVADDDERLARELQAEEHGLRRRTSARAQT